VPDYGHELKFGVFVTPTAAAHEQVVRTAVTADVLGLDSVSIQDHPYQRAFLDTWTLLTHLAAHTERVHLFPNVANLPLRHPAVLARSAATLDILSNGRAELGLGAGAFWDAIAALGGPRRTAGEAVEALAEAVAVIRALWAPGRTPRLGGAHYSLEGAKSGPFPVHDLGIYLGAYKPRMLRLTGRVADGWLPSSGYLPPSDLAAANKMIDEAALAAGRDPADVVRLYNLSGDFAGQTHAWVEQLAELALEEGMSHFVLAVDLGDDRALRRFAEEVAPAVRELVTEERLMPGSLRPEPSGRPVAPSTTGNGVLGVTPTPPPERLLSDALPWDETSRPRVAAPEGATYDDSGRQQSRHLVDVHDHLRAELAQLRDLVDQVARGQLGVGVARTAINQMTMRQNSWTLGTYCESYCRVVTTHHTLEDVSMFPRLRRLEPRIVPVIDRLQQEHHAIHDVLEQVDRALVAMVGDPDQDVSGVRRAVDLLTDTLLSHLAYEEEQLVEPLARHGLQ
jgi:alkanesulfonate monooxygenase SsuD/methylene tetrahydromethanopterin reductase-like flavin-dependent oxidoreductase (luciferase family)/hemerythrin-like domain-containing protein